MRSQVVKSESYFSKIYLMPQLFKMLVAFSLFLLLTIVGYFYLQAQALEELRQVSLRKLELERELQQGVISKTEISKLTQKTDAEKAEYEKTLKAFPPESKVNDLLAQISKLGTSYGLKFLYFKPEGAIAKGYYAGIPVNISVVGEFHQIGDFLSGIANLPETVVVINPMTITKENSKSNILTLQFTATVYHTLPTSLNISL